MSRRGPARPASRSRGGSTATRPGTRSAWSSANPLGSEAGLSGPADLGDRTPVLQVDQMLAAYGRADPAPDRAAQQAERLGQARQPVLGDLLGLQHDPGQGPVTNWSAVEQEPDAARPARARTTEIHRRQPPAVHVQAALLADLAPARLPGRLAVGLHDATRDRPARLVGRLEDQQPARPVEDERPRRYRDRRERLRERLFARIRSRLSITGHRPGGPSSAAC